MRESKVAGGQSNYRNYGLELHEEVHVVASSHPSAITEYTQMQGKEREITIER